MAMTDTPYASGFNSQRRKPGLLRRFFPALFMFSWKTLLILAFLVSGIALGGLFNFVNTVTAYEKPELIPEADAVVVLTGGPARIEHALELVDTSKGQRLLISGVNPKTSDKALRRTAKAHSALFDCCVDVGREAINTVGNAEEARDWVVKHRFTTLILVTSDYHMPRSLLEFRLRMPDREFLSYPIPVQDLREKGWYRKPDNVRLIVSEYVKYLRAQGRGILASETMKPLRDLLGGT